MYIFERVQSTDVAVASTVVTAGSMDVIQLRRCPYETKCLKLVWFWSASQDHGWTSDRLPSDVHQTTERPAMTVLRRQKLNLIVIIRSRRGLNVAWKSSQSRIPPSHYEHFLRRRSDDFQTISRRRVHHSPELCAPNIFTSDYMLLYLNIPEYLNMNDYAW